MPERPVVANVASRLRVARVECAIADVQGIVDLDRSDEGARLARAAERALLELYVYERGLPVI